MFLKQFSEMQGPFFILKLPSLHFLSSHFNTLSPCSLHAAEKIAPLLLDRPWLWAAGQFSWFPDIVHHQQPDGGRGKTRRRKREQEQWKTDTLGRREGKGKEKRERKHQRSPRFELPPSGLSFRNKNLITWLFLQKNRGRIVERTAATANEAG